MYQKCREKKSFDKKIQVSNEKDRLCSKCIMLSVLFCQYIVKCVKIHRFQSIGLDFVVFINTFSSSWFQVLDFHIEQPTMTKHCDARTSGNQSSWIVKSRKKISSFWFLFFLLFKCYVGSLLCFYQSTLYMLSFAAFFFTFAISFTWRQKTYDSIESFLVVGLFCFMCFLESMHKSL